eukprot:2274872-Rhodomonas_salina.2
MEVADMAYGCALTCVVLASLVACVVSSRYCETRSPCVLYRSLSVLTCRFSYSTLYRSQCGTRPAQHTPCSTPVLVLKCVPVPAGGRREVQHVAVPLPLHRRDGR